jgi:hypothetical protein
MKESFKIQALFPTRGSVLYEAWLDSRIHGIMTNTDAVIDPVIDGKFSIWNGYITGLTIQLTRNTEIVQQWRTTDFSEEDPDSIVRITLKETPG